MRKKIVIILLGLVFLTPGINARKRWIPKIATASGASYIMEENFEATGYDLTGWATGGTVDPDQSTSGLSLEASQCVKLTGTGAEANVDRTFSPAVGEGWVFFYLRFSALPADQVKMVRINGASGATSMFFGYINATGHWLVEDQNGSLSAASGDTLSINTSYKALFHYKKSATASTCDMEIVTTAGTFNGSGTDFVAAAADGTTNIDGDTLFFYGGKGASTGATVFFDKVKVDDAVIVSNP